MATLGGFIVGFVFIVVVFADEKVIDRNELPMQKKRGECVTFTAKHYYPLLKENQTNIKWFKYSTELSNETKKELKIYKLTSSDSALYYSEMQTEGGKEVTRYWLTVEDCDINEKDNYL
ncbi:uncharacterized protein LOC110246575 [Exaiptasia diaphana]|uniref:Uncharacterized protein n=1 Tax=Exaiptasia diaphana TaxID=2652724 RepID=A0A913XRJ6_EXADI|nr:uncharacterized protein LOC110246575 [Exaiptasia diaphana]